MTRIAQAWIKRLLGFAMIAGTALALAACNGGLGMIDVYYNASPEDREKFVDAAFVKGEAKGNMAYSPHDLLGITALYMDWDEYRSLITDHESLLRYGLGLVLARNPGLTYERFTEMAGPSAVAEITPELFVYYRLWGADLLDTVRSRPENAYLVEREALYKARVPGAADVNRLRYVELLRDDEAFSRFLADDDFARETLRSVIDDGDTVDYLKLGPIYTGVTPGTGS